MSARRSSRSRLTTASHSRRQKTGMFPKGFPDVSRLFPKGDSGFDRVLDNCFSIVFQLFFKSLRDNPQNRYLKVWRGKSLIELAALLICLFFAPYFLRQEIADLWGGLCGNAGPEAFSAVGSQNKACPPGF